MNIYLDFSLVIIGLAALWWAGDIVVRYAIEVAEAFNISTFFLGFIVLAIAADIPELGITIASALNGVSEVAVGDLVGASFCDLALVIGLTLVIAGNKVHVSLADTRKLLAILCLALLALVFVFSLGSINHWHGLGLIISYFLALAWLWKTQEPEDVSPREVIHSYSKIFIAGLIAKLLAGIGLVIIASGITVQYAVSLATAMNVTPEIIGATILGFGTALPELALSLGALRRGQYALSLGPVLGTVLDKTTLILGILAFCSRSPISVTGLAWAYWFMFVAFAILGFGLLNTKRMGRSTGVVLMVLFVSYLAYQARL